MSGGSIILFREFRLVLEEYMNPSLGGQAGRMSKTSVSSMGNPVSICAAAALSLMVLSIRMPS